MLIVDDVATAAIGGVMGAGTTEVRDDSTDVLLEAAVWDPAAVSRTERRLHLPSEAGRRYERDVDPAISVAALDRCATLLAEIAGGTVEPTLTDWRGDPPRDDWSLPPVQMAADLPDRMAGVELPAGHHGPAADADRRRGRRTATALTVTPPSWRPDLLQPADLVEEVLRLEGLELIPSVLPPAPAGRGLTAGPAAPPGDRQVAGAVRLRRDPADAVPARRGVRRLGAARPTTPAGAPPRCSTRWRPTGRSWPPRCCPVCWKRWSRNVSRGIVDVALFAIAQVVQPTDADHGLSRLIPVDRRPTDDEIAVARRVAAAPAAARRRGADRAA